MNEHGWTGGMNWIPVNERMPEPETECIVWSPGNAQHGPYAFLDTWREQRECPVSFSTVSVPIGLGWDSSDSDSITHWMPLPPPPTGQTVSQYPVAWRDKHDHAIFYAEHPGESYQVEPLYLGTGGAKGVDSLRTALEKIADMDPHELRADDLGMAAGIARQALGAYGVSRLDGETFCSKASAGEKE